jgi:hypothetical protein
MNLILKVEYEELNRHFKSSRVKLSFEYNSLGTNMAILPLHLVIARRVLMQRSEVISIK